MKKYIILIIIVAALALGGVLIVTKKNNEPVINQQTTVLGAKIVAENAQLIDVRTPEEYAAGHAKGSVNIPIETIQNGDLTKISKDKPVYLYCRTGLISFYKCGIHFFITFQY